MYYLSSSLKHKLFDSQSDFHLQLGQCINGIINYKPYFYDNEIALKAPLHISTKKITSIKKGLHYFNLGKIM